MTIKMKKLAKIILFSCLSISALSFSACDLINGQRDLRNKSEDDTHYATVAVLVRNNEFTTQSTETTTSLASERTATPVLPSSITYSLTATEILNGSTTSTPRSYTSNHSETQADSTFPVEKKYMLKLPEGRWKITATGKNADSQEILSGTGREFDVAADGKYTEIVPVYFIANNGTGSINLSITTTGTNTTTDTNIDHLVISGTGNGDEQPVLDKTYPVVNGVISINATSIPAGTYHPTLTFYNSDDTIVTIIKETFNIRKNMTTDKWFKSGYALYLKEKTGTPYPREADFILTQTIIDTLENDTFYVKGTGAESTLISGTGNDEENDGTRVAPYRTLNAALARINELNNDNYDANYTAANTHERKSFTIFCDGNIGTEAIPLTIQPQHNLTLTIERIEDSSSSTITTSLFTFGGNQPTNVTIKDINLKGNIKLDYGNLTLDSVSVLPFDTDASKGLLTYNGGQLTIGGNTSFASGITLNAANKKIYLASPNTAATQTKIRTGSNGTGYTESSVILEGTGTESDQSSHIDVSTADLTKFLWENPSPLSGDFPYYALRLKDVEGKQKAVLGNTSFNITSIPIHDDISFVLTNYIESGSTLTTTPPTYEYEITGYNSSDDGITGSITIKMYVQKGDTKLKLNDEESTVSFESISLTLYGGNETPIAPTAEHPCTTATLTDTSSEPVIDYTVVTLTANNIRPGTYSLKMSAIIDGIPYSQQSAAIYASLGDN